MSDVPHRPLVFDTLSANHNDEISILSNIPALSSSNRLIAITFATEESQSFNQGHQVNKDGTSPSSDLVGDYYFKFTRIFL